MSTLNKLGIATKGTSKAAKLFEQLMPDFKNISYNNPSEYITSLWEAYKAYKPYNRDLNGRFFELILTTLLIRENLLPIYLSAYVAFVPNIKYDLMLFTKERGPICLSSKTSLRERYKQADLEAVALKYVHRKALSYLLTLDPGEASKNKARIKSGDIIGLDDVILATSAEFDDLIKDLKQFEPIEPPTVKVITSSQIISEEKVKKI
ncbi:hypothetical protein [Olivibacter sp. XZL3]|uniref:hypothetical protein n=1 Tax=Olivibacter sp. XZL3 TaxID=1735116 RepID=UPI001064FF60|nr:hypothetical protein [Olivibacter sp. XZL3]